MPFTLEDILEEFADTAHLGSREWHDGVRVFGERRKRKRNKPNPRVGTDAYARWRASIIAWRQAHPDRVQEHRRRRRPKARIESARWREANREKDRACKRRYKQKLRDRRRLRKAVLLALIIQAALALENT